MAQILSHQNRSLSQNELFPLDRMIIGCPLAFHKALKAEGYAVGRFRARSLMKKAGLEVKRPKRFKKTTDSRHKLPVAPNLLNQDTATTQAALYNNSS